jgi:hypothetical protein
MFASELYDIIKEQLRDDCFVGMNPAWHYFRTKLLIRAHLMDKVEQPCVWKWSSHAST